MHNTIPVNSLSLSLFFALSLLFMQWLINYVLTADAKTTTSDNSLTQGKVLFSYLGGSECEDMFVDAY